MGLEHRGRAHDIKKSVAEMLPKKVAQRWEDRIRQNRIEKSGYTPLNEVVSFDINPDFPEEVQLHIHENLTKTPIEANRRMLEALRLLADKLKGDESLHHIKTVSGYSWIVYNSPDILRRLGFRVSGFNHVDKMALASMDRQSFINRFAG